MIMEQRCVKAQASQKQRIDLVLLDLVLPGMDGAQRFRETRKLDQDVPVVIVTSYPDSGIMSEALKVGPFDIVRNHFSQEQLSNIVERLFPRQVGLDSIRLDQEPRRLEVSALAQSKLATLGEVATGIAREINQPLTYIHTMIEATQEDMEHNRWDDITI